MGSQAGRGVESGEERESLCHYSGRVKRVWERDAANATHDIQ